MTLTVADAMLYTTVKLTGLAAGVEVGTGTGFFWRIDEGAAHVIVLATNKHVIAGCDQLRAVCHIADPANPSLPGGRMVALEMTIEPSGVFEHPDATVDLVMLGFSDFLDRADAAGAPIFLRTLNAQNVPTDQEWANFDSIEDVIMVGYPRGISDTVNNRPIVRRGITATALNVSYNGNQEFVVDMACFPGSSGSPVFMNQTGYTDRATGSYMIDGRRFFLLGILYAGPLITQKGEIRLGDRPTVEVAAMMHLGQIIKATRLLELDALIRSKLPPPARA